MAGKSVGTIFVELDLDADRYIRSQKRLYQEATTTSTKIEENFRRLGIKSDNTFNLMRASAQNAFNAIKNNSKSTANDIYRAEKELQSKLARIDKEQFGSRTSFLAQMRSNWLGVTAAITTAYFAARRVASQVKEVAMLAARYETLGIVMETVGRNAGYSAEQMEANAKGLQKLGITMLASRSATVKAVQAHIQLADSLKIARIAQDAAVIANINSSEAFEQLVYGIQTAQVRVLKTMGINVSFEDSYKKLARSIGKTTAELSEEEKLQARVNAVMERGQDIVGTYEAAMTTAGKKILSFERYVENFKVQMGEAFGPATSLLVDRATETMKEFSAVITEEETQKSLMRMANGFTVIASAAMSAAGAMARFSDNWKYVFPMGWAVQSLIGQPPDTANWLSGTSTFKIPAQTGGGGGGGGTTTTPLPKFRNMTLEDYLGIDKASMGRLAINTGTATDLLNKLNGAAEKTYTTLEKIHAGGGINALLFKYGAYDDTVPEDLFELTFGENYTEKLSEKATNMVDIMKDAFDGWASSWSATLTNMVMGADFSFKEITKQFIAMVTQMVIQKRIIEPLFSGPLAFLGIGSAKGNVFSGPGIGAYENRVVSRPTVFPFATGIGMMGEAGPEAIMPLVRTKKGDLGIRAEGGAGTYNANITINGSVDSKERVKDVEVAVKSAFYQLVVKERRFGGVLT